MKVPVKHLVVAAIAVLAWGIFFFAPRPEEDTPVRIDPGEIHRAKAHNQAEANFRRMEKERKAKQGKIGRVLGIPEGAPPPPQPRKKPNA